MAAGMTTETELSAALEAIEDAVNSRRADPELLLPQLATLLLGLQSDSEHRPRLHRLMGVVQNRLKLDHDALRELREARARAEAASPPNYTELAKIGRETAVVHAWRGDDHRAERELLSALAFASMEGDESETAKIIAEFGRIELEARRFDNVVMLLRRFASPGMRAKLPEREAHCMRINLCQALNQTGAYQEALQGTAELHGELPQDAKRPHFLLRLEMARAFAGLKRFGEASATLAKAEEMLPESESAFERSEYLQAKTEIEESKGGPAAVENLEQLIEEFRYQRLVVREAVARRALANALFKQRETARAREALSNGLRSAVQANLVDLADEIRADMLKSAGGEHLEELGEAIDLIGGGTAIERRFIRLNRLGKGGSGEVHRAIDLRDGRHVALKKLELRGLGKDRRQSIIKIVKNEYAAAGKLDDPRIARVLDLMMVPGGPMLIVQRFIDGPTLRQLYASGVPVPRLLEMLAKIAEALGYLHGKQVVHRDLKPENVIVAAEDRPVLIDLGIALVSGRADGLQRFGTPPYVAPEQLRGEKVDGSADIYALGQMVAEIWGGRVPSRFTLGVLRRATEKTLIPRAIREIVRGMLKADPSRRFRDLKLIAEALRSQSRQLEQS